MRSPDFSSFLKDNYEIHNFNHASAILMNDFPGEWADIEAVLTNFRLHKRWILTPGGRKSSIANALDNDFFSRGWVEKRFDTEITVDGISRKSPTHAVDYYKNRIAVEVEWNNKNPFFDRDLNNFRMLFDLKVISAGVIITRCDELQLLFNQLGRGDAYGASTTRMGKLLPLLNGGAGGGCPILVFGITKRLYVDE